MSLTAFGITSLIFESHKPKPAPLTSRLKLCSAVCTAEGRLVCWCRFRGARFLFCFVSAEPLLAGVAQRVTHGSASRSEQGPQERFPVPLL